ncbi:probable glutathione S-transferase [Lycium ferocissimum]|uniref:probable glutathione S-transferase n=1 Tax=Lycium ferocissimum TaxID=112874 RepID=UPI002814E857|nr:probable glutathione S-transferase [Lycium ferocissimum]
MAHGEVILLDFWPSMYGMRVKVALAEKGVKYEYKEQNLADKNPILLEMNPIFKKIPVLIHNGKPICESLNVVQYIDEVWKDKVTFLPSDPYEKYQALFWADYVEKVFDSGRKLWMEKGGEQLTRKENYIDSLRMLEGILGDKTYFGGGKIGFLDIALIGICSWFYTYEKFGEFSTEIEAPKIIAWVKRCMKMESVSKSVAEPLKVYDFALQIRKHYGLE